MRIFMGAMVALLLAGIVGFIGTRPDSVDAADSGLEAMTKPEYDSRGRLIRPEGFRRWIFVGASMGLSYSGEERAPEKQIFHHIYIQPEAYDHYVETGKFPEKTMLVMENYSAGSKENNTAKGKVEGKHEFGTLNGHFEDARVGLEVALKDSETFEDGWAYFNFSNFGDRTKLMEKGKAFNKSMCWDCHSEHAADDNVFIQFYPVLREHYEARNK
ncbi:MAG: cytochrome P460 family protein [Candidatus Hydrogenedentota bacterium]